MTYEEELGAAVNRYLELAKHASGAVEADASLVKPIAELDKLFWKRIDGILDQRVRENPERLELQEADREVLDCGLLADDLLRDDAPKLRAEISTEIMEPGEPRFYYLSEWLGERYRTQAALEGLKQVEESKVPPPAFPDSPVLLRLAEARSKLYRAMMPLFENLPGFSTQAVQLVSSGRLDQTIAGFRGAGDAASDSQKARLLDLRTSILDRARSRCTSPRQLEMFDLMKEVDDRTTVEVARVAAPIEEVHGTEAKSEGTDARRAFLMAEIKIVRSNIKLGVAGAGITRTHSVLLSSARRASKSELADLVHHIEEVDPKLPGRPNILIAPFTGSGFFEWDRDTVYVPLISTRNTEESIVNGIANYRIMIDNLHEGGRLKREYKRRRRVEDFRGQFLMDYRNWVLGIGRGYRGAMSSEAYEFFRDVIGPNGEHLFAPAEWLHYSPNDIHELRKSLRAKMNRGDATYVDHLKLAYVYHREALPDAALEQLTIATRLNPIDGRAMFALGWLSNQIGKTDKARSALKECLNIAPNTLWHIYANDELGKVT